jgi:hypothetical protein
VLRVRGISPAVAAERGYRSAHTISEVKRLGFTERQARVPGLVIPLFSVAGELCGYQYRPDEPRTGERGRPVKYESPKGSQPQLDCPPRARRWVLDPEQPLLITEGSLKADSAASHDLACLAIAGVWNWRSQDVMAALDQIPLKQRPVYLAFDSDFQRNPAVEAALRRLAAVLRQRGAVVRAIVLPESQPGTKMGLDDWLAQGHGAIDLFRLPTIGFDDSDEPDGGEGGAEAGSTGPYAIRNGGLWRVETRSGPDGQPRVNQVPLTNFVARIVADVARDDGSGEVTRAFEIVAEMGGRRRTFTVPASQFASLGWATEHLGASAVVYPGWGTRDHARVAIQLLSGDVPERRVYTHTGWRQIGDTWCYLHAGGAIGPGGQVGQDADVCTSLDGGLARARLPNPPDGDAAVAAIRASLAILDLAPDVVSVPVFVAIYRAALGSTDFALHLAGPTGAGKSELAALAQQHYGAGFDARHLPASWLSTANALELVAFTAKDMLVVIDDFAPAGASPDVARQHRDADRVLRGQGNAAGRDRLRPDATLRGGRAPRGLILSTGEDVPRGQSLRSRLLIIDIGPEDLRWDRISACQREAAAGQYAAAMAAFLAWVAGRYETVQAALRADTLALREAAQQSAAHRRTPAIVASLGAGFRTWLAFAQEAGALTGQEAAALWQRAWAALGAAAARQPAHQAEAEPARQFLTLVAALLASGRAHVADVHGEAPEHASAWGWRWDGERWRPQGDRIGWVDGDHLYLEPAASYAAVQRLARDSGEALPVSAATLRRRLAERGLLVREGAREATTIRRTVEGQRRAVLCVRTDALITRADIHPENPDQPDQPAGAAENVPELRGVLGPPGQVSWSGFWSDSDHSRENLTTKPNQNPQQPCGNGAVRGPGGQVGQVFREPIDGDRCGDTHAGNDSLGADGAPTAWWQRPEGEVP